MKAALQYFSVDPTKCSLHCHSKWRKSSRKCNLYNIKNSVSMPKPDTVNRDKEKTTVSQHSA